MSLYTEHESFFPNLPGYRSKVIPSGSKRTSLRIINGMNVITDEYLPRLSGNLDYNDTSARLLTSLLPSTTSLVSKPKMKADMDKIGITLTFQGYFEEDVPYSTSSMDKKRIRICNILYFPENQTISVVEKPQPNSGIPQGTLVRKDTIYKNDNTLINPEDLIPGKQIEIYKRLYHITGCDRFTKNYLSQEYSIDDIPSYSVPVDQHSLYRLNVENGPSDDWNKYRAKKNYSKAYMEAKLGNAVDNSGRDGFIKYGNQKLKFGCVWDNTDKLYGDVTEFSLVYHLSDDTVEIFAAHLPNSGRDIFSRLLKRGKLPKKALVSSSNNIGRVNTDEYYNWKDFKVGMQLNVYARVLKIVDADSFTRDFYSSKGKILDYMERSSFTDRYYNDSNTNSNINALLYAERPIPPPTGFGSEEDSLRSCVGSLQIQPPHFKPLGENKVLSFKAILYSGGPDDVDRRFVLMYFVQDGTLKILEPQIRNSGFTGGTFLSRRAHKLSNGEPLNERQLYIGAKVTIMNNVFLLQETNDTTLHWMEEHKLPKANITNIINKIGPYLLDDAMNGTLEQKFQLYDVKGKIDLAALKAVLGSYDLVWYDNDDYNSSTDNSNTAITDTTNYDVDNDNNSNRYSNSNSKLVDHEILTLFRAEENRSKDMDYKVLINMIVNSTQETV